MNLIVQARKWWSTLACGETDIATLARQEGVGDSYMTRVIRAAFLSPDVTDAILAGTQLAELSAARLRDADAIPVRWSEQEVRFLPSRTSR